jgi:hypothetical protein
MNVGGFHLKVESAFSLRRKNYGFSFLFKYRFASHKSCRHVDIICRIDPYRLRPADCPFPGVFRCSCSYSVLDFRNRKRRHRDKNLLGNETPQRTRLLTGLQGKRPNPLRRAQRPINKLSNYIAEPSLAADDFLKDRNNPYIDISNKGKCRMPFHHEVAGLMTKFVIIL